MQSITTQCRWSEARDTWVVSARSVSGVRIYRPIRNDEDRTNGEGSLVARANIASELCDKLGWTGTRIGGSLGRDGSDMVWVSTETDNRFTTTREE